MRGNFKLDMETGIMLVKLDVSVSTDHLKEYKMLVVSNPIDENMIIHKGKNVHYFFFFFLALLVFYHSVLGRL